MTLFKMIFRVVVVSAFVIAVFSLVRFLQLEGDTSVVDSSLLRISSVLRSVEHYIDSKITASSQSQLPGNVPATHYQRDARGAIDIFEKRGSIVCRVYSVCRDNSGQILLPLWMRNHANVLAQKCALSNFRFVHYSRLKNFPPSPADKDWLGPNIPTPALYTFATSYLSNFYSPSNSSTSKLLNDHTTRRVCLAPDVSYARNVSVCNMVPEAHIIRPYTLINMDSRSPFGYSDFQEKLRRGFMKTHAEQLTILTPASGILRSSRICFRSLIMTPTLDPLAGQTVPSPDSFQSPARSIPNITESVDLALDSVNDIMDNSVDDEDGYEQSQKKDWKTENESSTVDTNTTEVKKVASLSEYVNSTESQAVEVVEKTSASEEGSKNATKGTADAPLPSEANVTENGPNSNPSYQNDTNSNDGNLNNQTSNNTVASNEVQTEGKNTSAELGKTQEKYSPGPRVLEASGNHTSDNVNESSTFNSNGTNRSEEIDDMNKELSAKVELLDGSTLARADAAISREVEEELLTYGGVEMFTHRTLDSEPRNDSNPSKAYGVCRMYRICRGEDSSLLLPRWLQRFKKTLEQHCGLPKVKFIPNVEFDLMYNRLRREVTERKGIDGILKATGLRAQPNFEMDLDLVGTRVYRAQEQHFVTDLFQDALHSIDAVLSHRPSNDSTFRRECIYRTTNLNTSRASHFVCDDAVTYEAAIRPSFVMTDLGQKKSPSTKYIRGIVAMVPPKGRVNTRMLFVSNLSKSGKDKATCFRSVLLSQKEYPPHTVLHKEERNVFYEHNRLSRESVGVVPTKGGVVSRARIGEACRVRLTILEPRQVGTVEQRGTIENENEVIRMARQLTGALAAERGLEGLRLYVRKFKHEGTSVAYASKVMQESEIILSGNDPAMTSIMFTRPQTAVVEVQPFGYSTGPYRNFARSLNLNYTAVTAAPDPMAFEKCVQDKYKKDWPRDMEEEKMEAHMNGLLRLYREAIEKYDGKVSSLDLTSSVYADGKIREGSIPLERVCARGQKLAVNAEKVGWYLAQKAVHICELQVNASVAM